MIKKGKNINDQQLLRMGDGHCLKKKEVQRIARGEDRATGSR
jgi:hypothetical protein